MEPITPSRYSSSLYHHVRRGSPFDLEHVDHERKRDQGSPSTSTRLSASTSASTSTAAHSPCAYTYSASQSPGNHQPKHLPRPRSSLLSLSPFAMLQRHAADKSSPRASYRTASSAFRTPALTDSLIKGQSGAAAGDGASSHTHAAAYRQAPHCSHSVDSAPSTQFTSSQPSSSCVSSTSAATSLYTSFWSSQQHSVSSSYTPYSSQSQSSSHRQSQAMIFDQPQATTYDQLQATTFDHHLISPTPTPRFALMDPPSKGQAVFRQYRHRLSHTRREGHGRDQLPMDNNDDDDGDEEVESEEDAPVDGTVDPHHVQSQVYTPHTTTPTPSTHRQYRLSASPSTPIKSTRYGLPYAYGSSSSSSSSATSSKLSPTGTSHSRPYRSAANGKYNYPLTPSPVKRRRFDLTLPLPSTLTPLAHVQGYGHVQTSYRHRNVLSSLDSPTTLQARRRSAMGPISPLRLCAAATTATARGQQQGYRWGASVLGSPTRKSTGNASVLAVTPPETQTQLQAGASQMISTSEDEAGSTSSTVSEAEEEQASVCGFVEDTTAEADSDEEVDQLLRPKQEANEGQEIATVDMQPDQIKDEAEEDATRDLPRATNTCAVLSPTSFTSSTSPFLSPLASPRRPAARRSPHRTIPVRRSKRLRSDSNSEDEEEAQVRRAIEESIKDAECLGVGSASNRSGVEDEPEEEEEEKLDGHSTGPSASAETEEHDPGENPLAAPVAPLPAATETEIATANPSTASPQLVHTPLPRLRDLPSHVELDTSFAGFYARYKIPCQIPSSLHALVFPPASSLPFPSSSSSSVLSRAASLATLSIPSATRNDTASSSTSSLSPLNLYTPRYVRGVGMNKEGLCPICFHNFSRQHRHTNQNSSALALALKPSVYARAWFKMKISAYNYHMHVHHGINHHTGLPLDPPVKFRARDVVHKKAKGNSNGRGAGGSGGEGSVNGTAAAARDRQVMKQGLCHVCKKWVDLQSVKDVDVKVPEIYWRKHAAKCHKSNRLVDGEADQYGSAVFVDDELYRHVVEVLKATDSAN